MQNTEYYSVDDLWRSARRDYLAGVTAAVVCQKYKVSMSSFRLHARKGGWRRMDQPDCGVAPEPEEYHPGDDCSFADLARQTFLNIRRAVGTGRAAEANAWMRLYDKLADRARAQVLSDLPDLAPPREPEPETPEEPVLLITAEAEIHPVHPVSSECTSPETPASPDAEADPESPAPDTLDSLFPKRPTPGAKQALRTSTALPLPIRDGGWGGQPGRPPLAFRANARPGRHDRSHPPAADPFRT